MSLAEIALLLLAVTPLFCASRDASRPPEDDAGVRLEVVADAVWRIPPEGGSTAIAISLRITNGSGEPLVFNLLDTLAISLSDPQGRVLPMDGGRDGTSPGKPLSDPIAPGEVLVIDRSASLAWTKDETLRLQGDDGFGGIWYIDGLEPGIHRLRVSYESRSTRGQRETRVWTGSVAAPPVEVELEVN